MHGDLLPAGGRATVNRDRQLCAAPASAAGRRVSCSAPDGMDRLAAGSESRRGFIRVPRDAKAPRDAKDRGMSLDRSEPLPGPRTASRGRFTCFYNPSQVACCSGMP